MGWLKTITTKKIKEIHYLGQYKMPESIPCDGAKPMHLIEYVDNKEKNSNNY